MNKIHAILLSMAFALVAACGSGNSTPKVPVVFMPTQAEVPFPTDLLMERGGDFTVDIPVADPDDESDPAVAMNAQDGFSTIMPVVIDVEQPDDGSQRDVDGSTVIAGDTVCLFEMDFDPTLGAPTTVAGEVSPGDYVATTQGESVIVLPLRPLKPKTSYLVMLSTAIKTDDGRRLKRSRDYSITSSTQPLIDSQGKSRVKELSDAEAQGLEPLRQLTVLHQQVVADDKGIPVNNIALTTTFRTQSTADVLEAVHANAEGLSFFVSNTGLTTEDVGFDGDADIYAGALTVPYFLTAAGHPQDTAPLTTWWNGAGGSNLTAFNPVLVATGTIEIPILVTVPNGDEKPAGGWPVVIYQHGLTSDRSEVFTVADKLAGSGFVTVAIDLPLHGITDTANPFKSSIERTFDLDLVNNATFAPGPDGNIDDSGFHYVNLASLLTTRDNIRQGAADLFTLVQSIPLLDFENNETPGDLDSGTVHFWGHSLGGVTGVSFAAIETDIDATMFAMAGGGIARMFEASPSFGPLLKAGLAANGVFEGTPEYDQFFLAAQTLLDSVDPVNYATRAALAHPIYVSEIIGDPPTDPPDLVVVNSVPGWPLSGTEPMAALMGLTGITSTSTNPLGIRGIVRYTSGTHTSYQRPAEAPTVGPEILQAAMDYFESGGTTITVTDLTTVE
ncbi:MAG: alpha/beta fold hydrolase [Planctomycetota bacterium]